MLSIAKETIILHSCNAHQNVLLPLPVALDVGAPMIVQQFMTQLNKTSSEACQALHA